MGWRDAQATEIAGVLRREGHDIDSTSSKTDVIVINTCGFLEAAKAESIRAIKDAVREKKAGGFTSELWRLPQLLAFSRLPI